MFKRVLKCTEYVGKDKEWHRKYSKEWRKQEKKLHNDYQSSNESRPFSQYKASKKKPKSDPF